MLLALSPGASATPDDAPESLASLMSRFAEGGAVRARFREERTMAILTHPIVTTGTLYFVPPDQMARVVDQPGPTTVLVRGSRVDIQDSTGHRGFDLGGSQLAKGLVENLMIVLRGDLSGLESRFEVDYSIDGDQWRLELVPRDEDIRAVVRRLRLEGVGGRLDRMETLEANGDATTVAFSKVETGAALGPKELMEHIGWSPAGEAP